MLRRRSEIKQLFNDSTLPSSAADERLYNAVTAFLVNQEALLSLGRPIVLRTTYGIAAEPNRLYSNIYIDAVAASLR